MTGETRKLTKASAAIAAQRPEEIEVSGAKVREFAETLRAMQTMGSQLTASLQSQWKLEQQRAEQTAALVHDLKTPLAIITGNADLLAEDGVQVVTGPIFGDRSKPELRNQRLDNTAILKRAGVLTAICTDHPENPEQYLPMAAALCAKNGVDPEEAMAAVTRDAARIAGIADRVGTLEVGKDADIAVFRGSPLELNASVEAVFIDGRRVK